MRDVTMHAIYSPAAHAAAVLREEGRLCRPNLNPNRFDSRKQSHSAARRCTPEVLSSARLP